ncbi:MAG: hypothetical protein CL774_04210 [Chloroflexi bacterium]|nr:hypothetical protein [Chloroflexota bacterium]|tara:strand:+ start:4372 stop:5223 length:852 start_codon:yes stop_codon:yes gene_type:complete
MKNKFLYDFISVGSLSYDRNKYDEVIDDKLVAGGAAAYSAKTSINLGLRTGMITAFNEDYPLKKYLKQVDLITKNKANLPIFYNYFSGQTREQKLFDFSTDITNKNLPENLSSKILFVAPLFDEISSDCYEWFDHEISCLVPSGWFREKRDNSSIFLKNNISKIHKGKWDIIVVSSDEIRSSNINLSDLINISKYLCVTKGNDGVEIFLNDENFSIPAFEVIHKDLNGAGDVWAASFTIAISQGKNHIESAKFANACSAISIKYKGLDFTFNEREIYQLVDSL